MKMRGVTYSRLQMIQMMQLTVENVSCGMFYVFQRGDVIVKPGDMTKMCILSKLLDQSFFFFHFKAVWL